MTMSLLHLPFLLFILGKLQDGVCGFLFSVADEATGVDDNGIRAGHRTYTVSSLLERAQNALAVHGFLEHPRLTIETFMRAFLWCEIPCRSLQ